MGTGRRQRTSEEGEIPGRTAHRPPWKAVLVAAAFLAWLGVLLVVGWLGRI